MIHRAVSADHHAEFPGIQNQLRRIVLQVFFGAVIKDTTLFFSKLHTVYIDIMKSELIPAMGCTEPGCLAFVAAKVRETLGGIPEHCTFTISGNLIKNTKSVVVPGTNGMKEIKAAVAAGFVSCSSDDGLEVLERVWEEDIPVIQDYIDNHAINILPSEGNELLYVDASAYGAGDHARVILSGGHLRIVYYTLKRTGTCYIV